MLEARDLWAGPPGAEPAVRGACLRVGPGEWLALAGANGSGKTSLLLALAGLWPLSRGSLTWRGEPWGTGTPPARRAAVAVVMQDPASQLVTGSVAEEIAFGPRNLGWPEERCRRGVAGWGAAFGLEGLLDRPPLGLSAGEQQRVLLAGALAAEPDLLLLDEPAAHLDQGWRHRALDRVAEVRAARGTTVVWATQDLEETARADRVCELRDGALHHGVPGQAPRPPGRERVASRPMAWVHLMPPSQPAGPLIRVPAAVALDLPTRGVLHLSGPNGAGKSVLLSALAGLLDCPQVRVAWSGGRPSRVSFAAQHPEEQIFAGTVEEEMTSSAVARGVDPTLARRRAGRLLADAGSPDPERLLRRDPWSLSSGQRRLAVVGGALLAPAPLLLLDEPTAGLDGPARGALSHWVREAAAGACAVVASQDPAWAGALADSVVELPAGGPA